MANAVFGWPIYSDAGALYTPTLSGGAWSGTLPLTNLQDRRLSKVARSTNALAASTQFETDLKTARAVRVIALPVHTISSAGTIRVRGGSVAGLGSGVVYDSGTVNVWPAGHTAETVAGMNLGYTLVPTAAQTARYWLVEITDTGNAAGYVDVGRLILAGGFQPSINMAQGARLGLDTATERTVTDGGAAFYAVKPVRRTIQFSLPQLPESEALGTAFDLQRIAGTAAQIHFVFDPLDTTYMHRRAFLATLAELSPLEYVEYARNTVGFSLREEL